MFTRKVSLASITLACASAWSFGAAADATSFELGAYVNWPGGKEIVAGDYASAIKTARANGSSNSIDVLVATTNLCVAYTATGAFTEARGACDHAVELARREDAIDLRPFKGGTATSRALSNRGVLRALSGDSTGAASDLRAAAKLKEAFPAAGSNLAHLESSPAYRVALASGNAD
jgi:Flp pilus assembly protein TadD